MRSVFLLFMLIHNEYMTQCQIYFRCYSNVGRMGGEQELSLAGPCLKKGTAIHELMHALGFWHEQNRPDRDFWVQIIMSNIQTGMCRIVTVCFTCIMITFFHNDFGYKR